MFAFIINGSNEPGVFSPVMSVFDYGIEPDHQ